MLEITEGKFIHQKLQSNLSLGITTIITQTNRDMEISKDRIKVKITITTIIGKEMEITHNEDGIEIGNRDMIIP